MRWSSCPESCLQTEGVTEHNTTTDGGTSWTGQESGKTKEWETIVCRPSTILYGDAVDSPFAVQLRKASLKYIAASALLHAGAYFKSTFLLKENTVLQLVEGDDDDQRPIFTEGRAIERWAAPTDRHRYPFRGTVQSIDCLEKARTRSNLCKSITSSRWRPPAKHWVWKNKFWHAMQEKDEFMVGLLLGSKSSLKRRNNLLPVSKINSI